MGFRRSLVCAVAMIAPLNPAIAQRSVRAGQQMSLRATLGTDSPTVIANARSQCASGRQPAIIARSRGLGSTTLPDAPEFCIAVLTRLGRDGRLSVVQDKRWPTGSPALSLDSGFVVGYRKGGTLPLDLPGYAALKSTIARCLAQAEPDKDLCYSAGYAAGLRAASGDIITVG